MKFLQKLGKALMLPVACLPICGILMGIGYALCPATMQGGDITGIVQQIGFFLVKAGGALIDNMALLFAIGVGVGMADDNDGTAGLAALAILADDHQPSCLQDVVYSDMEMDAELYAFAKIGNQFIGILAGLIGSTCYNKFKGTKLPDWLSFFSGKRCVAIVCRCFYHCICYSVLRMAVVLRSTGSSWRSYRRTWSSWSWYLCILEPSADPIRSASRTEQCILV